jgi:hypothetical protein
MLLRCGLVLDRRGDEAPVRGSLSAVDEAKLAGLRHLLAEARADEVIAEVTEEEVAAGWTRFQQRHPAGTEQPSDDPDWWAVELWMSSEWSSDERRVRTGILRLVELAGSDDELEYIGISLMELDFFRSNPSRLEWVETQAAGSDRFRRTLAGLYLWNAGDRVLERVERADGVELPRPSRSS